MDLISRQAAIDAIEAVFPVDPMKSEYAQGIACGAALAKTYIEQLPSAQPEPLTLRVNHELTKEEYDKLMHDIKDAPIVLLPPAQPSADVVEVVRCKDCKHLFEDNGCPLRTWWTHLENDFCSYGERREDEYDLISRQAAIDAILAVTGNSSVRELYEHVQEHGLSDMWSGGVNAAIDIIIAVPSAQPEPKKGKWIDISDGVFDAVRCNMCGKIKTDPSDFCPNCGADMRGEEDEMR